MLQQISAIHLQLSELIEQKKPHPSQKVLISNKTICV